MKKILFIISIFFLSLLTVKAEEIPSNVYYVNDGLYAYLENNEVSLNENEKLYIEYRINDNSLELIEIVPNQKIFFLTDEVEDDALIDSRFVILADDYTYLDWSTKEGITKFDFATKPEVKIKNLEYKNDFTYEITNSKEIEEYFKLYKEIYDLDIEYKEEYEVDGEWSSKKPDDLGDIKLNFRVYYEVGKVKSNYSNILTYENHPDTCMFDSTLCCTQILNVSLCIWLAFISIFIILILVIVDHKRRLKKEA